MIIIAYDADGRELKPGMQVKVKGFNKLYYILGLHCSDTKGEVGKLKGVILADATLSDILILEPDDKPGKAQSITNMEPTGVYSKDIPKLIDKLKSLE